MFTSMINVPLLATALALVPNEPLAPPVPTCRVPPSIVVAPP